MKLLRIHIFLIPRVISIKVCSGIFNLFFSDYFFVHILSFITLIPYHNQHIPYFITFSKIFLYFFDNSIFGFHLKELWHRLTNFRDYDSHILSTISSPPSFHDQLNKGKKKRLQEYFRFCNNLQDISSSYYSFWYIIHLWIHYHLKLWFHQKL